MSDPIGYFMAKFRELWRDGKDARFTVECHAGQAWMSIHHRLPYPPPSSSQPSRSQPSPSRLRRRARRAHARAVAEQAAATSVHAAADDEPVKSDVAVQTEKLKTVDATVQVDSQEEQSGPAPLPPEPSQDQHHHHCQAGHEHRQAVVHVDQKQQEQPNYFNSFSNSRIPQLDGNVSPDPQCSQCNVCQKVLETMDDYNWHFYTEHGREDCRLLLSMLNF